ncbi:MAG: DUF3791 domain-containing protein [Planctomycetaceae bacterium]|jgi:HD superfamily phosphohydrolase YqeK|nr:DUF3791 domain-containing protein [Planctomycetaceae bacterium]
MSQLSFKLFCIEKYADIKSIPSNEVFRLFEQNGILTMLDEDYELLHGYGFEYIAQEIDTILEAIKNDTLSRLNSSGGEICYHNG